METIGNKISEIRKRKGLTQEELSELSKINLRTLQRIEKGDSAPHSYTLQKLCQVLEIKIEDILDYGKVEDVKFLQFFHLSVLTFIVIPLGNIILPMILWMTKRDKITGLNAHAIALLNFQILWTILFFVGTFTYFMNFINRWFDTSNIFYLLILLCLLNVVYPLFVVVAIGNGRKCVYYLSVIRFIK